MNKRLKKILRDQQGFTLIELVIVLAVIGLLIGIAIPVYQHVLESARGRADQSSAAMVENAVQMYRAEKGELPEVSGKDQESDFNALITILHEEGYFQQEALSASQEGKVFQYDRNTGKVTLGP